MTFDPKKTRGYLKSFTIAHYRKCTMEDAKEHAALNGTGRGMTSCGVKCLLVGFFDIGQELLHKARIFVRASIEYKEKPYFTEHHRLQDLALLNWLAAGEHDSKSLKQSVRLKERWFSEKRTISKPEVQAALPHYLDAEEYETLMRRCEGAGLTKPANLRRIQGEGTMCYVIARHRLGLDYTPAEVEAAVDTFLKRHVPGWLGGAGRYTDAAHWMKLAFWNQGDDPIATVLRCYVYLAGLKPPKYP